MLDSTGFLLSLLVIVVFVAGMVFHGHQSERLEPVRIKIDRGQRGRYGRR